MKLIGYAGRLFADLHVGANYPDGMQQGPFRTIVALNKAGDVPAYATMRQDPRTITVEFIVKATYDTEETIMTLLGALHPNSDEPRVLVGQITGLGTNNGKQVEMLATCGQWRQGAVNNVFVDFHAVDDKWYERYDTDTTEIAVTGATAIPLYNKGGATISPILKLPWDTQRTTENADVGWKWKRTITPSNTSGRNWNRTRLTFDLGDTSAWVTGGKALASGNDVRIRRGRKELARTLTNFNTGRTWAHVFDTIQNGDTATYEVWYGNPDATAPDDLSTRTLNATDYAADDLEGDTGTASAGSTTSLTDATKTWETDEWKNGFLLAVSGTGSVRARRIASNTGTVITLNRALNTAFAAGTVYVLWKSGIFMDGGRVTGSVTSTGFTDNLHTNKWGPNSLIGARITFHGGTADPATNTIIGNGTDSVTLQTTMSVNPTAGDSYTIQRYGIFNWNVDRTVFGRTHRGIWRTNLYFSNGGKVMYGDETPGGWVPWLMLDNQDDFAVGRFVDEGSGGGHSVNIQPYTYARRSVRSDNTWPEKKQADGTAFFDARGMIGFDWLYQMKNEGGIGIVEVRTQAADGDNWQIVASDSTTRASLVDVTSSGATGHVDMSADDDIAVRIWTGVLPLDKVEIPSTAKKSRSIELRNAVRLLAYLDISGCGGLSAGLWSVGSEVAIYDYQATCRIGGGSASIPPYNKIFFGPGLGLESGQEIWVNGQPSPGAPLFGVYASDVLVKRAPWAGVIYRHEYDLDGNDVATIARDLIPIPPGINLVANEDNVTNWSIANSAGVTATLGNDTGTLYDGGTTSIKVTVTTTPAGAWTIALTYPTISLIPGTLYEFGMVYRRASLTNAITCQMKVDWTKDSAAAGSDTSQTVGGAMANAAQWYSAGTGKKIFEGDATNGPTTEAHITITIAGTGSTSGAIYIDPVTLGLIPNLYINEDEIGAIAARMSFRRAWFG